MTELSLALLGPPVVMRDGAPVSFDTRKAIALLALLAVTGREHSREQLADLLWPDADSAKGRASLRRTLSVTAAAMGAGLTISRAAVALEPAAVRVDVGEFEALITRPDAASLERAVRLYRDDFLAGFVLRGCPEFEEWQASVAEGLRQSLARGLQRLVAACIADGDLERAAGHARRWLQLDPLHEPAHQAIIRLHGWSGQRSAAMRQYRSLVRVLDRDLAVRPLPETTRLYEDVRAGRLGPPPVRLGAPGPAGADGAAGARSSSSSEARPSSSLEARSSSEDGSSEVGSSGARSPGAGALEARPLEAGPDEGRPGEGRPGEGRADEAAGVWPLVGREAELAALRAAWQATGPRGRVVAIAGPVGIGKTRLVTEFQAEAAKGRPGAVVLSVRCHDGETALPFVLAADLLRLALAVRPELPAMLPAQTAAMAGRLVPALAAAHPDAAAPALDSPVAVTRLYAAIADTLLAATRVPAGASGARASAGVIVVEDVQWADSSSLGLLAYLVRRLADWPLLLVLSWEEEQAGRLRTLRTALAEADEQSLGVMIEPGPLGPDAIGELLGLEGMPPVKVDQLMAETRGLPMLVREYIEALRSGVADQEQADWWPPASVRDLLRARLQAVSEPTRQMLTAAAVLGSDNDADLLRAVSGRGEDEIVEAIDEALARSLLTEIPPPGAHQAPMYGFPYEALRRTAYESATLARRRLLHGRAADNLTRRHERDPASTRAATVAGHLQLAGRDSEAAQWWWRAAEVARELYAHAEAHAHLVRALALGYPQLPGRIALGEQLVVLGRYREALAEFETAAAIAGGEGASDRATQASIEHQLADVHHRLGDWDLAEAHLAVVTELVVGAEPARLAQVEADRAVVAYRRGDAEQAAAFGRSALASARAAADPGATAQALNVLGMLAARAGDTAAAEGYLRDSLAEARRQPGAPGTSGARPEGASERSDEAGRRPEGAGQRPEEAGRRPEVADRAAAPPLGAAVAALNNLARLLADTGRGEEALAVAAEALELGSELGDQHRVAALHTNMADLLHASGEGEAAMTHLKEAARRFASVDVGDAPRPEIWTLVEW
jgi:DNA-binding SARP family transcriptional activator/tetratricopeptide (TPR) repeat protein